MANFGFMDLYFIAVWLFSNDRNSWYAPVFTSMMLSAAAVVLAYNACNFEIPPVPAPATKKTGRKRYRNRGKANTNPDTTLERVCLTPQSEDWTIGDETAWKSGLIARMKDHGYKTEEPSWKEEEYSGFLQLYDEYECPDS